MDITYVCSVIYMTEISHYPLKNKKKERNMRVTVHQMKVNKMQSLKQMSAKLRKIDITDCNSNLYLLNLWL